MVSSTFFTTASAGRRALPSTPHGDLYVVDALAGSSGLYRLPMDRPAEAEQVVSGGHLVGLAFDPRGGLVLASSDTVFRVSVRCTAPFRCKGLIPHSSADRLHRLFLTT